MGMDAPATSWSAARERQAHARLLCVRALRDARRQPGRLDHRLPSLIDQLQVRFPDLSINHKNLYRWDRAERIFGEEILYDRRGGDMRSPRRFAPVIYHAVLRRVAGLPADQAGRMTTRAAHRHRWPTRTLDSLERLLAGEFAPPPFTPPDVTDDRPGRRALSVAAFRWARSAWSNRLPVSIIVAALVAALRDHFDEPCSRTSLYLWASKTEHGSTAHSPGGQHRSNRLSSHLNNVRSGNVSAEVAPSAEVTLGAQPR